MNETPPPTEGSHTYLWTFQHVAQLDALLRHGVLYGDWRYVDPHCEEAYRYMCGVMETCGLNCGTAPPVWAWHSCWGNQKAPDREVATQFLSLAQLAENNMVMLTLACPDDQYLLSSYHQWCDLVYFPSLEEGRYCDLEATWQEANETERRILEIDFSSLEDDMVQATLPLVRKEWLRQVHRV